MSPEPVTLLPHQPPAVEHLQKFPRSLFGDDMGLGKTIVVLYWIWKYLRDPSARVLLIVPPGLVGNWKKEAAIFGFSSHIVQTTKPPLTVPTEKIIIIGYNLLQYHWQWIGAVPFKFCAIDECQALKNPETVQSKASRAICKRIERICAMSGTPFENSVYEFWPVLNLLWPTEFPSRSGFGARYCAPEKKPWGYEYKGSTNAAELRQRLLALGFFRRDISIMPDMPPLHRAVKLFPLSPHSRAIYEEASDKFLAWLARHNTRRAMRAAKSEALTRVGYLKRLASALTIHSKLQWIKEWQQLNNEPVCVYGLSQLVADAIQKEYGNRFLYAVGGLPPSHRQQLVDAFQHPASPYIGWYGQMRSAGTGITLTRSRTMFLIEPDFTPTIHAQVEARVRRIGQRRACYSYLMLAENTVEHAIARVLQERFDTLSKIINGEKSVSIRMAVHDLLMREMVRSRGKFGCTV